MMTHGRRWLMLALLLSAACDDAGGGFTDEMPDDLPAGRCDETSTGEDCETGGQAGSSSSSSSSSSGEPASDCLVDGCMGQGVCAAAWDAEAEVRGSFECRFACVPLLDDSAWCSDDASCCDAGARCTGRGYCILEESGSTSTGGGG